MWKWLHPYAKPDAAYQLCGKLLPWFASLGFLFLAVGTVLGLAYAPADYQQGTVFESFISMFPQRYGRWAFTCRWPSPHLSG